MFTLCAFETKRVFFYFWTRNVFLKLVKWFLFQNGQRGSLLVLLAAFCLTKSLSCNLAIIIRDDVYFKVFKRISEKLFQVFKEDSVQIPTQRSRILSFHPDGPAMRLDTHQWREAKQFKVASVRTLWQHVRMLFIVQEDSSFPSQTQSEKTACTHPDNRATPSGLRDPC
jgi:hypothetical protein